MTREQINDKEKKARDAFQDWKIDASKRADFLHDFVMNEGKVRRTSQGRPQLKWGKVIKETRFEVEKCAWVIEYYADNGHILLPDEIVNTDARKTVIKFQPIGVLGSIMPWNFPYWQALRFGSSFISDWQYNSIETS